MSSGPRPIRLLLADDHPLILAGIKSALYGRRHLFVAGEAHSGAEALSLAMKLKPDIAVLDISMPGRGGLAVAKALAGSLPSCRVVFLSMHDDREYIRRAVSAGARGYVQKDAGPAALVRAIEAVHSGRTFFSDAASQALVSEVVKAGGRMAEEPADVLTKREREVLVGVADGLTNKEIARALSIGVRTVETHRARMMQKLGIATVPAATKYALAHGLIEP